MHSQCTKNKNSNHCVYHIDDLDLVSILELEVLLKEEIPINAAGDSTKTSDTIILALVMTLLCVQLITLRSSEEKVLFEVIGCLVSYLTASIRKLQECVPRVREAAGLMTSPDIQNTIHNMTSTTQQGAVGTVSTIQPRTSADNSADNN